MQRATQPAEIFMIAIIDYGIGNISSIKNMVTHVGGEVQCTADPAVVAAARALIIPGVGAFDACVRAFRSSPVSDAVVDCVLGQGVPVLGICVGLQMMGRSSEEGVEAGLGWIAADAKRLSPQPESGLKVPHIGWRDVECRCVNPLLGGEGREQRFYFAHSYHVVCDNCDDVLATCEYGGPVTA